MTTRGLACLKLTSSHPHPLPLPEIPLMLLTGEEGLKGVHIHRLPQAASYSQAHLLHKADDRRLAGSASRHPAHILVSQWVYLS